MLPEAEESLIMSLKKGCSKVGGWDGEREVLLAEAMKDHSVPTDHQHYTQERAQGLKNDHVYREYVCRRVLCM